MQLEPVAGESNTAILVAIDAGVGRVLETFEAKLAYDAAKQRQIDQLHDEVQQHRAGLVARTIRPLALGTIKLHDDIGKLIAAWRIKPVEELTPTRFFALLEGLQEDIEILLGQNGVEPFRTAQASFDPRRQRVVRRVVVDDSGLVGTVAESVRLGFAQAAEILEKERVAIYELAPATARPSSDVLTPAAEAAALATSVPKQES